MGISLQSAGSFPSICGGFPLTARGLVPVVIFLLLLSHYKEIENDNQTFSLGLVGRMTCLALNIYRCGGKHIPCKIRLVLM